jgi:microcystin degradation protein MlrC
MRGEARPVMARVGIPALVRGDELITATGRFGLAIGQAREIEAEDGGLSAGMLIGNPFTDVPELKSYSVVVTHNDASRAEREALRLARTLWEHHESMRMHLVSLDEMATIVAANREGTVALVDAADATSSGASGDSNAIIRHLIESGYQGRVLAPIVDAAAVERAFNVGVHQTVTIPVGGTLDPRFEPLVVTGRVCHLSDGRFKSESFGEIWLAGRSVLLEAGNLTLVISSRAVNLYDRAFFFSHGQDPKHFDAVVVKSPHCEPQMYSDWCARMVYVDAPGSTSANLPTLGHIRCERPIFPLDANVAFNPEARIFQRPRYRNPQEPPK